MNTDVMFSSKSDEWSTPQEMFDMLNHAFKFDLDPCADESNHKCDLYYTKEQDGLKQPWGGHSVFCNPPYGREIGRWVKRASEQSKLPNTTVVMLLPARTDTKWFHEYIYHEEVIIFIEGRLKFGGQKNSAPFPSMVVIFFNKCGKKATKELAI